MIIHINSDFGYKFSTKSIARMNVYGNSYSCNDKIKSSPHLVLMNLSVGAARIMTTMCLRSLLRS